MSPPLMAMIGSRKVTRLPSPILLWESFLTEPQRNHLHRLCYLSGFDGQWPEVNSPAKRLV
jgi:hypothetical protein